MSAAPILTELEEDTAATLARVDQRLAAVTELASAAWPVLDQAAMTGLAGEVVQVIAPHSEADPVAILGQFLQMFGSAIGHGPYFPVESDRHHTNLFLLLVGPTASGRKGTALGRVRRLFEGVDADYIRDHLASGLSSGEGLIYHVRDPIYKTEPVKEKGVVVRNARVMTDEGVTDKRCLVIEPEFASTCRVLGREGNTLSPVIRNAWDGGLKLRTMTKNSPLEATEPHIAIVGHVTAEELRRTLDRTELGNGFANRFVFLCVRRSQCLPNGGELSPADFVPLVDALRLTVSKARGIERMTRDAEAEADWAAAYPTLSGEKPGVWGAVASRAEAQTLRLSMLYALLDGSAEIRRPHLAAALALWEYAAASVRYVFGDSTGDLVADRAWDAIRQTPEGLSQADLYKVFDNNLSGGRLAGALRLLEQMGRIAPRQVDTGGRPARRWAVKGK